MKLAMLGAGGHGVALLCLLKHCGFSDITIYDDAYYEGMSCGSYPVSGTGADIAKTMPVVLAVGDPHLRKKLSESGLNVFKENLIHPLASIEEGVLMGESNQIFAQAYINTHSQIADNCIINTGARIEHEACIGSHCHISVSASVCGRTTVGSGSFIGAGATVIDELQIGEGVVVGAGAVVVSDIKDAGTYVGVPARKTTKTF